MYLSIQKNYVHVQCHVVQKEVLKYLTRIYSVTGIVLSLPRTEDAQSIYMRPPSDKPQAVSCGAFYIVEV